MNTNCSIDGCKRIILAKHLCSMHYTRFRKHGILGEFHPLLMKNKGISCLVDKCDRPAKTKGMCFMHYQRTTIYGEPGIHSSYHGTGWINDSGYKMIHDKGRNRPEHRVIMEQYLGRSLKNYETIHHKNGQKLDNRIDNLEIWNTHQPRGQRIDDKLKYSREILALYGSDLERKKYLEYL